MVEKFGDESYQTDAAQNCVEFLGQILETFRGTFDQSASFEIVPNNGHRVFEKDTEPFTFPNTDPSFFKKSSGVLPSICSSPRIGCQSTSVGTAISSGLVSARTRSLSTTLRSKRSVQYGGLTIRRCASFSAMDGKSREYCSKPDSYKAQYDPNYCSVCMEGATKPSWLGCGHVFCDGCLATHLSTRDELLAQKVYAGLGKYACGMSDGKEIPDLPLPRCPCCNQDTGEIGDFSHTYHRLYKCSLKRLMVSRAQFRLKQSCGRPPRDVCASEGISSLWVWKRGRYSGSSRERTQARRKGHSRIRIVATRKASTKIAAGTKA